MEGEQACDCDHSPLTVDEEFIAFFIETVTLDSDKGDTTNRTASSAERYDEYIAVNGQEAVTRHCNAFLIGFESLDMAGESFYQDAHSPDPAQPLARHHVTPFLFAVICNNHMIVRRMIENNRPDVGLECCLDIESKDCMVHGLCALTIAVSLNYYSMAELLLQEGGAEVDQPTESLSTALRIACHSRDIEMIQLLLKYKANPNFMNIYEHTPLMLSAFLGDEDAVLVLIEHGANMDHQAKCGATAMHFAAQENKQPVVSLLMSLGAKLKPNDAGHTPLMVAALNNRMDVVHEFLTVPSLTTVQEKITALELLGASYITVFHDRLSVEDVYHYFKCGLLLRYTGMDEVNCQCTCCHIQDNLTDEQKHVPPVQYPKTVGAPMDTYEFHQESQTLEQLNAIQNNERKLFLECFVVLERILGPKSIHLADILKRFGAILADSLEPFMANKLWLRALRIKIDARVFVGLDFYHFTKLMDKMQRYRQNYVEFLKQGLGLAVDYYTVRPRPFGYQSLLFPTPIEEFTINSHKNVKASLRSMGHGENSDPTRDSDILLYMLLFMLANVAANFKFYSPNDQAAFRKLTYWLCRSNITESNTGRTLLHLAFSTDEYIRNINPGSVAFPNVKLASFLVSCGADVTATDVLHNTPLHYLAQFCMKDTTARFDDHINLMDAMVKSRISKLHNLPESHNANYLHNLPENLQSAGNPQSADTLPSNPEADLEDGILPGNRKIPLFYGGEVRAHLDAVNVLGKTAFQMNRNVLTNIVLNQFQTVPALKCLAARVVHAKYFQDAAYQFTLIKAERARRPATNFVQFITGMITTDFVGAGTNPKCYMHNFERLAEDMARPEEALKAMVHYSERLKLSLELIQFVEMHGPCKFAHI